MKCKAKTEAEMREVEAPWPKTDADLVEYIGSLVDRPHDYGTCVYAMSLAATAAFHYVSHKLGVTGFQASCADMDIIRRTRGIDGPFRLVDYANVLYPQYADRFTNQPVSQDTADWLKERAIKQLQDDSHTGTHPDVLAHWQALSRGTLPFGMYVSQS